MLRINWTFLRRVAGSRLGMLLVVLCWGFILLVFVHLPLHQPQLVDCSPRGQEVYEFSMLDRMYSIWEGIPMLALYPAMLTTAALLKLLQKLFLLSCVPTARLELVLFVVASSIQCMFVGFAVEAFVRGIWRSRRPPNKSNVAKKTWLAVFLLFLPVSAYADQESGPTAYATASADGKYIFLMFVPGRVPEAEVPLVEGRRILGRIVAVNYPASGLYRNDGSNTPLWTVDWYAYSVIVPSDGVHLIRRGPWAKTLSGEAYTFYANGKELRSYRISALADTAVLLKRTVSHFEWEERATVDDSRHVLAVTTFSKESFVFDYTTGEMLSARRPLRILLIVSVLGFVLVAAWLIKRTLTVRGRATGVCNSD